MSDKTNIYGWLPAAIVAGMIIILLGSISYFTDDIANEWSNFHTWMNATGVEVTKTIHEFSDGTVDTNPYWDARIRSLAGIVIMFVIGPSLWIFGRINNQHKTGEDRLKKGPAWYTGSTLVFGAMMLFGVTSVMQYNNYRKTQKSIDQTRNADHLRKDLAALAVRASELYMLPEERGGGGGDFTTVIGNDGRANPISLEDLDQNIRKNGNDYVLGPVNSDSVITIYGIGKVQGSDPDFKNANGETGRLQLTIRVEPKSGILRFVTEGNNTY